MIFSLGLAFLSNPRQNAAVPENDRQPGSLVKPSFTYNGDNLQNAFASLRTTGKFVSKSSPCLNFVLPVCLVKARCPPGRKFPSLMPIGLEWTRIFQISPWKVKIFTFCLLYALLEERFFSFFVCQNVSNLYI